MSKFHLIAGAALMSLGTLATAQDGLTREQVKTELARALAAGEVPSSGSYPIVSIAARAAGAQGRAFDSGLTREQVKAELAVAMANGEVPSSGSYPIVSTAARAAGAQGRAFAPPGLTREQVRAELERARASGELARMPFEGSQH